MKSCFLFPGQGSQDLNSLKTLLSICKNSNQIVECLNQVFKKNMLDVFENAYDKDFKKPEICQPLVVLTNILAFNSLKEKELNFNYVFGHSLGQYAAFYAAEVLNLKDTFEILKLRIKAINSVKTNQQGGMCAIIGADLKLIEKQCQNFNVYCANYNSPQQIVVAGEINNLKNFVLEIEKFAKRCIFLDVSHAFHSKLMQGAAKIFEEEIKSFNFSQPKIKIYSNVTAKPIENKDEFKKLLVLHLTKPVLFFKTILELEKNNVEIFVEAGKKPTLLSFVKKTCLYSKNCFNIFDSNSILKITEFFKTKV